MPPDSSNGGTSPIYTCQKITELLVMKKDDFSVIPNERADCKASYWKVMGYPAQRNSSGESKRIEGFITCRNCLKTYVHGKATGTTHLNRHKCMTTTKPKSSTSGAPLRQTSIETAWTNADLKSVKLTSKENERIKELCSKWICESMRPFSVMKDNGLRRLVQECVQLGSKYGMISANDILPSDKTTSRHIHQLAEDYRRTFSLKMRDAYDNHALTIIPDMWSDPHKKLSYLGASATFIDEHSTFHSIDLFCQIYQEEDKRGESILQALSKGLHPFGLLDLSKLNFVCDRGSNFIRGLKDYSPVFCYAHRLNNILKRCFWQTQRRKMKQAAGTTTNTSNKSDVSSSSDDEYEPIVSTTGTDSQRASRTEASKSKEPEPIPDCVQEILKTIDHSKKLVRYIRRTGLNEEIKENGGLSLQQSTVVRWLSMVELLENLLASFQSTKMVLMKRKQQSRVSNIDKIVVKQLVRLLKPFKHVIQIIQTGNSPSLYMVLICTLTLRETLASFDALLEHNRGIGEDKNNSENEENEQNEGGDEELDGLRFLRQRLASLLDSMFQLDIRHYAAAILHPRYRQLRGITTTERDRCYSYIRQRLKAIWKMEQIKLKEVQADGAGQPEKKKMKTSFFERFEDNDLSDEYDDFENDQQTTSPSSTDELHRYLSLQIDKSTLTSNPMEFWSQHQLSFPLLWKLARSIHSIPATSANVERQFSSAGFVFNQRRTNLNPAQLNNILFVRSFERLYLNKP